MNLLLFDSSKLDSGKLRLKLPDPQLAYLFAYRQHQPGDSLRVGAIRGGTGNAVIEEINHESMLLSVPELAPAEAPPKTSLLLALPRPQILKRVLEASSSIGVNRVYLLGSERTQKSYFQSSLLRPEMLERYLLQGLEQGVSTWLPEIEVHPRLSVFLRDVLPALLAETPRGELLLAEPAARVSLESLIQGAAQRLKKDTRVLLGIGPEQGWSEVERNKFQEQGALEVASGARVLRVDTAVSALLSQVEMLRRISATRE